MGKIVQLSQLINQRNDIERKMDRLENQGLDESNEYFQLNAKLDEIIPTILELQKKQQQLKKEMEDALIEEFKKISELNSERVIIKAMIEEFGCDFRDQYIIGENYTVYSHARQSEYFGDNKSWECEDSIAAKAKVNQLIYWRVYNRYFRDGCSHENLIKLKNRIITIKSC